MTDYDALRAAAEAATPGPWGQRVDDVRSIYGGNDELVVDTCGWDRDYDNAAYIAAASPDVVLGLLDRLAAAEDRRWWRSAAATSAHRCQTAWPGNARPTAAMLADYLEACCRDCRVRIAEHALADADAALDCLARGHDYLARELEAGRAALVAHLTLSEAPLTAAAPHSDQPDAHDDGERGGEAGGRA